MNHEQIKEKIFEFYDGESSSEDKRFIQAHVMSCSECRDGLAEWEKTSAFFFKDQAAIEPSEYFVTRVMARLPDGSRKSFRFFDAPMFKLGLALSGFVVIVWGYLSINARSSDSIETLLMADSRSGAVSNWVIADDVIPSDEFARYTLGEE